MIPSWCPFAAGALPVAAVAAAIATLTVSVPRILKQAIWNSDTVPAMVLADSMRDVGQRGKVTVFQAAYPWLGRLLAPCQDTGCLDGSTDRVCRGDRGVDRI